MAPSTTEPTPTPIRAAIISSGLESGLLEQMTERLLAAGFRDVQTFDEIARVVQAPGEGGPARLAPSLEGRMLIVMDQTIGGRSAYDAHAVLEAAPELIGPRFLLLLDDTADAAVFTAWKAGIHCVLTKPFNMDEFATFAARLHAALASEQTGTAAEGSP